MPTDKIYKGVTGFFGRHWNGDYSLGRSYWFHNFLVNLIGLALIPLILPLFKDFPARYFSTAFLCFFSLWFFAWIWAIRGTWASANKHVSRGGQRGWAIAAQAMIVVAILRNISDISGMSENLADHLQVALGRQGGPEYSIQISADGKAVELNGGLNDGAADALTKTLDLAPAVNTVVLNSTGGWVREGNLVAQVISKRKLNTYVEGQCSSACTIAFLSGIDRAASPNAHIGFHQFISIGESSTSSKDENEAREVYQYARIPKYFIDKILATSSKDIWYPSQEELLKANVITRNSLGGETASLATKIHNREEVVLELMQNKAFATLAQRFPDEFNKFVDKFWEKIQLRETDAEIFSSERSLLTNVYTKLMPIASDKSLIEVNRLAIDQASALNEKSKEACAEYAFSTDKSSNFQTLIPAALINREQQLLIDMLLTSDSKYRQQVNLKSAEHVFQKVGQQMQLREAQIIISPETRSKAKPEEICSAFISFAKSIDSLAMKDKIMALRATYGAQN